MHLVPARSSPARLRVLPGTRLTGARLRTARRRALAAATAAAVTAASCGAVPEPESYQPTSTSVAGTPASLAIRPGAVATATQEGPQGLSPPAGPTTVDGTSGFVPQSVDGEVAEVLVATTTGVLGATPAKAVPVAGAAGEMPVVRAVDDLLGGLVVQRAASGAARTGSRTGNSQAGSTQGNQNGDIVWVADDATGPLSLAADGSRLLDVGYGEGSPYVVVLRPSGSIDRIRLADLTVTPMEHLMADQSLLALSVSGTRHAATIADSRCGSLQLRSFAGQALALPGPRPADCKVPRRPAYPLVALSPDGQSLAYTVVSYRADGLEVTTELVVVDLVTGDDRGRRVIAQNGERVTSLSFDGARAVFLRRSATAAVAAIVDPGTTAPETRLPLPQPQAATSVAFARNPVG